MARLQQHYREKVAAELTAKFGYTSPMQVPRLTKITLNMGVSEAVADKKVMDNAVSDLTKIAGHFFTVVLLESCHIYAALISSPLDLKTRTLLPSARTLMPTRSALPVAALKMATLD